MSDNDQSRISRRTFVGRTGLLAGGMLAGARGSAAVAAEPVGANQGLPRRVLGKTDVPIAVLTLGTAPCGHSVRVSARQVAQIVNAALDQGINYVDTSPVYNCAEEGIGMALGRRRKEIFLATKVWADTIEAAEKSFSRSLRMMKTDYVDLLYLHNLASRKVDRAWDPDGVFTWMLKQKKAGKIRFVGASGHAKVKRFVPFIESGELDVVLLVLNFVDRYTYGVEETVLPVAREHKVGVVAMKVFGGIQGGFRNYNGPPRRAQLDEQHMELAIRYTMGLPDVTTMSIGVHDAGQLRKNIEMVKNYRPLTPQEHDQLAQLGRKLASQWGPHFGPVAE